MIKITFEAWTHLITHKNELLRAFFDGLRFDIGGS